MIKIAFSGVPGSGKTTIMNEVSKILSLKHKVREVEDVFLKNTFDMEQKPGFHSQFFFLSTQINMENIGISKTPDILLCDRSALDQWAYWLKHIGKRELSPSRLEKHLLLEHIFSFWQKTYDQVFIVKAGIKEVLERNDSDGLRFAGEEYIEDIEAIYNSEITKRDLKVTEIWNNGSPDECAGQAVQLINDFMLLSNMGD